MDRHLSDEYIAQFAGGARLVMMASLKSPALAHRILEHTPEDTFVSYNPGSSEFLEHPGDLIVVMRRRNPKLLELNDDELRQLFGASGEANLEDLAAKATEFSENVLCTLGAKGMLLSRRLSLGRTEHTLRPVTPLPDELVADTLGAGDRANAIATNGLFLGKSACVILDEVAEGTAQVIRHTGAHGDLYSKR
jgi:fructose-1-phosphate kinase PfkB-like protein